MFDVVQLFSIKLVYIDINFLFTMGKIMMGDVWQQFLHLIHQECGSRVVETWFKAISLHTWDVTTKTVYLEAPNSFVQEWVQKHYLSLMQTHMGRLLHVEIPRIAFVKPSSAGELVKQEQTNQIVPARVVSSKMQVGRAAQNKRSTYINQDHLFETFVVGPNNSLAYAAAYAVTERLGRLYNPLFIYGGSGLGKTHLLNAIANEIKAKNKEAVILYQTADRFVTEFINAIRFNKVHKFKEKYQLIDVLLIDDIQFIAHKDQTQEAFFHIFNMLYELHKQIVFSSDTSPMNLQGVAERLQSRFVSGLVTDIGMPSIETKMAIIKKKAAAQGHEFSDEIAHHIASTIVSSIRELEGALIRIFACSSLMQQKITLEFVQKIIKQTGKKIIKQPSHGFDHVLQTVSTHYACCPDDLRSKNRNKEIAQARQVAMFFLKQFTGKSLRTIGQFLGGRDHSTVLHGLEKIEEQIKKSVTFKNKMNQIEHEISNR